METRLRSPERLKKVHPNLCGVGEPLLKFPASVTGFPFKVNAPAPATNVRPEAISAGVSLVLLSRAVPVKFKGSVPVSGLLFQLAASLQLLSEGLAPFQIPAGTAVTARSMELFPVLFTRLAPYPGGRVPK